MYPEDREQFVSEEYIGYPVTVPVGENEYDFTLYRADKPDGNLEESQQTRDLVVLLPGLTFDSALDVPGIAGHLGEQRPDFLTLRYQGPFSISTYADVVEMAIGRVSDSGPRRVVFEGYCLGGTILAHILTRYSRQASRSFDISAAIFRSAIIDRTSYKSRFFSLLLKAATDERLDSRLFNFGFSGLRIARPNLPISGQDISGEVDRDLVRKQLNSIPDEVRLVIPGGIQVYYVGLDRDIVADDERNIQRLGLQDRQESVQMLKSAASGSPHQPDDYEELSRTQAELIICGLSGGE